MEPDTTNDSELPEPPRTRMPDPKTPSNTSKPGSSGKPKSVHPKLENPEKPGHPVPLAGHSSEQMSSGAAPAGSHARPQKDHGSHMGPLKQLTTRGPTTTTKPQKPVEMPSEAAEKVAKAGAIEAGHPPTAGKGTAPKNAARNVIENDISLSSAADNEEAPLEAPEDAENEEVEGKPHGYIETVSPPAADNEEAPLEAAEDAENEEVMNNPEEHHEEAKGANEEAPKHVNQTKVRPATDEDTNPPHGEATAPVDDTNEEANSSTPTAVDDTNEEAKAMTSTGRTKPKDEGKKNEADKREGPPVPKEKASTDTDEEEVRIPSSSVETEESPKPTKKSKQNAEDHGQESERPVPNAKDNEEDPESANDNDTEMTEAHEEEAPEEEDTQNQIPTENTSKETSNATSSNGDDSPVSSQSQAVELSESTKTTKRSEAPELQDKHPANGDSNPVKTAIAKPAVKTHSSHSHSIHANDHSHHAHEHTDVDKRNQEVQELKEFQKNENAIAQLEKDSKNNDEEIAHLQKERRQNSKEEVQKDISVLVDNLLTGATQEKIDKDIDNLAEDVV